VRDDAIHETPAKAAAVIVAAQSSATAVGDALSRGGLDLITIGLLAGALFMRRHHRRDLLAVYLAFNVGLFAILTFLSRGEVSVGIGFGVFGVLSIIRLRSEAYNNIEIAYFFLALSTALVNALPGRPLLLSIALDVVLVATMFIVDDADLMGGMTSCVVTLDRTYDDADSMRSDLAHRLHAHLGSVTVTEVDYVRETTTVEVRFRPLPQMVVAA
jgi:hypothetical protein